MRESDYEYCFTEQSGEFDCKAVRRMRTKHIYAGDTLEIEVEILKVKGPIGVGKAIATVGGKKAVSAEITFAIK